MIEVTYDENFPGNNPKKQNEYWQESIKISTELLIEASIKINKFSGKLINIKGLYQGKEFNLTSTIGLSKNSKNMRRR